MIFIYSILQFFRNFCDFYVLCSKTTNIRQTLAATVIIRTTISFNCSLILFAIKIPSVNAKLKAVIIILISSTNSHLFGTLIPLYPNASGNAVTTGVKIPKKLNTNRIFRFPVKSRFTNTKYPKRTNNIINNAKFVLLKKKSHLCSAIVKPFCSASYMHTGIINQFMSYEITRRKSIDAGTESPYSKHPPRL